jgi:hypothetical protein
LLLWPSPPSPTTVAWNLQKPKTLDEAVDKLVAVRLEEVRQGLAEQYAAKVALLAAKIGQLEGALQQQQQQQQAAAAQASRQSPATSNAGAVSSAKSSRAASAVRQ